MMSFGSPPACAQWMSVIAHHDEAGKIVVVASARFQPFSTHLITSQGITSWPLSGA
jgi:hypothetical protein